MNALFAPLHADAQRLQGVSLSQLIKDDPARATDFSCRVGPMYFNTARQGYDRLAWQHLLDLAENKNVKDAFSALFNGEKINNTEQRAVLHTSLRSDLSNAPAAKEAHALAVGVQQQMRQLVEQLEASPITDIVSVGIGGSDLGPRWLADALTSPTARFRVHFLSNVDGVAAQRILAKLNPATTAAILISKTFGTQETLLNGKILSDWLGNTSHLYAVSANPQRAMEAFGISPDHVLPLWDWVGGRYSLWSAVGFPIALAAGMDGFEQLLAGAALLDQHVLTAPLQDNLPVRHALTAIWNRNIAGHATHAVLAYDQRLALLPAYLQQLVMESLGKRVQKDGSVVQENTVPVWWGGVGTDTQHSFFQALHQGTSIIPADFIGTVQGDSPYTQNHAALLANLLAQSEAFANGQESDDPHRFYPGNRPNSLILLDAVNPYSLGALIAFYEHSVYVQSVVWGINAFDQFGVELGKQVANQLLPALAGKTQASDPVTQAFISQLNK